MGSSVAETMLAAIREAGVEDSTSEVVTDGIFVFRIPGGTKGVGIWKTLVDKQDALGGWPVIVGDPDRFGVVRDGLAEANIPQCRAELNDVPNGPPRIALRRDELERRQKMRDHFLKSGINVPEFLKEDVATKETALPAFPQMPDSFAAWARTAPASNRPLYTVNDLRGKPLPECLLAIVANSAPSDLPAFMCFGGFNECPRPSIQVAYCRDWNRRFGAVPICITHDVLELYVPRPPSTAEETWKVACEQQEYCDDIVSQGTGSIEALAQSIWKSPHWFFWWD